MSIRTLAAIICKSLLNGKILKKIRNFDYVRVYVEAN